MIMICRVHCLKLADEHYVLFVGKLDGKILTNHNIHVSSTYTYCVYICTPGQLTERQNQNSCRGIPILQYLNFNSRQL